MECLDTPDLGASANVISYTWNSQTLFQTEITLSCEVGEFEFIAFCSPFHSFHDSGRAFEELGVQDVVNQCGQHDASDPTVTWKYNSDNPLPNCIGRRIKKKGKMTVSM